MAIFREVTVYVLGSAMWKCIRTSPHLLPYSCTVTFFSTKPTNDVIKPFREIPRVPSLPILGAGWAYLPLIGKYDMHRMHEAAMSKYLEYGAIVREQINKNINVVHLFNVQDFQKIFRYEGQYPFRRLSASINHYRKDRKEFYKNRGLLETHGKSWYENRTLIQPHMLKLQTISKYFPAMDKVSQDFVQRISELRSSDGGEIHDFLGEINKWALETLGQVVLNKRLGCLSSQVDTGTIELIRSAIAINEQISDIEFCPLPLWKYFKTPLYREFEKNMDIFCGKVQELLIGYQENRKIEPMELDLTMLDNYVKLFKCPEDVAVWIIDLFLSGIDTTSTTVGCTLYNLARNTECQDKVYQEIRKIQGEELTLEELNKMIYLKACLKESLRLFPIIPAIFRILPEDSEASGYLIPAGTIVFMHTKVASLLPENFREPERFLPERFLRDSGGVQGVQSPFAFLPFGFGPRSCIGRRIAEQKIWILLFRIFERFRLEYHLDDIDLLTRIISVPDKPLRFQFHERRDYKNLRLRTVV